MIGQGCLRWASRLPDSNFSVTGSVSILIQSHGISSHWISPASGLAASAGISASQISSKPLLIRRGITQLSSPGSSRSRVSLLHWSSSGRREEVVLLDSLQKGSDEVGLDHHLSWFYYMSKSIKMQDFTGLTWKEHFLWKGKVERADTPFLTIYYHIPFCINMLQAACQSFNHHFIYIALYTKHKLEWSAKTSQNQEKWKYTSNISDFIVIKYDRLLIYWTHYLKYTQWDF